MSLKTRAFYLHFLYSGLRLYVCPMFKTTIKISSNIRKSLIITAVYAIVVLFAVFHHEPFGDELNVFMINRNYSGLELWRTITEGTPQLFFFMMAWPFVKSGLPFISMQLLCSFVNIAAVFVLNAFSPFPIALNLIITLSAPFMFFYPVVARCYSLLPLLFISAAISYIHLKKDNSDSIKSVHITMGPVGWMFLYAFSVGAIAGNHIVTFGFSVLLLLWLIYEKHFYFVKHDRNTLIAVMTAALPILVIFVQTLRTLKGENYIDISLMCFDSQNTISVLFYFFANFFDSSAGGALFRPWFDYDGILYRTAVVSGFILTVSIIFYFFKAGKKYGIAALVGILFPLYVHIKYPSIMPYRVFVVHLTFLFLFWIVFAEKKLTDKARKVGLFLACMLFLITIPSGIYITVLDYKMNFSAASDMGEYINKNLPVSDDQVIIGSIPWEISSVIYYLKKHHVYANNGQRIKAIMMPDNFDNLTNKIDSRFADKKKYYLLIKQHMEYISANKNLRLIHETPDALLPLERYCLYEEISPSK